MDKIEGISDRLDNFIKKANPAIDNMNSLSAGWKLVLSFFASIGIIAGGIYALLKLIHIKH